jgi:hypothetical protein
MSEGSPPQDSTLIEMENSPSNTVGFDILLKAPASEKTSNYVSK